MGEPLAKMTWCDVDSFLNKEKMLLRVGSLFQLLRGSQRGMRDAGVSMVPQLVGLVTGVFTSIMVARGLGPEGLGRYALVMSLAGLTAALSDLGVGQTALRYAARAAARGDHNSQMEVLRWAFRARLTLVVLVTGICALLAPWIATTLWHDNKLTWYLVLGLLGGVFAAMSSAPNIYFQSEKRFGMNAAVSSGQSLLRFAGIAILAMCGLWSLVSVLTLQLVTAGFACLAFCTIVPGAIFIEPRSPRLQAGGILSLLRPPQAGGEQSDFHQNTVQNFALQLMLATVITQITLQADTWTMGFFLGKDQLGQYSAATRFTLPLTIVLGALNTALWPRVSALTSEGDLLALLGRTFKISLLVALGATVYAVFAPLMAPWLLGNKYRNVVFLGQILCLRYCLSLLICPLGVVGYGLGMARTYWKINLLQLLIVLSVNILLLPVWGTMASAIALVLNDLVGAIIVGTIIWRKARKP
jgi:O-antigen/teichoic acid export membrane protein